MTKSTRRQMLGATASAAAAAALPAPGLARTLTQEMPWEPNDAFPPTPASSGGWAFLTGEEAELVDAIVDRLIPADDLGAGGKDAGCTFFIDRQLAGPYGNNAWLYTEGPHPDHPLPSQGLQTPLTPREQYRQGLAALVAHVKESFAGRSFAQLSAAEQDTLLKGLEAGTVKLAGFDGRMLFSLLLTNTMEGYFSDPVYGGNRDMVGWKLVGFPGTRYDYRDVIANPNKPYTLPPVAIGGRPAWKDKS